jgi:hypothetical protein
MSRLAYFKNVNPSVGLDATQNQMLNTLSGQIATKADSSDLTAGLAQKADSSAVTYALSAKADVSTVNSALSLKADSSAVSTVATALAQEVTDRTNAVASKLATSVYDARIVNEAVFFDSVSNSILLQDANGAELNYVALGLVSQ